MHRFLILALSSLLAACAVIAGRGSADPGDQSSGDASEVVAAVDDRLSVERHVTGLVGPTQMIAGPDGRLWVAQLGGPENAGDGQVVAVDPPSGDVAVLLEGLEKPTGIAWLDGSLWIATPTRLLRADGQPPGPPVVVLDGLPNNGRSQGTLTVTPDGLLLYETSGRERDGGPVDGSGSLWLLDPQQPDRPTRLASGLKNAYAQVHDADGRLWATEVAEPIGGVAAPDEVNRIDAGGDYGWPACVGDRMAVNSFGGDPERCGRTARPHATFEPGATPTSIVVSPFDEERLVVALWTTDRVVTVPLEDGGPSEPLLTGFGHPQHLLVDGDALLVSDHATGTIWRVHADA